MVNINISVLAEEEDNLEESMNEYSRNDKEAKITSKIIDKSVLQEIDEINDLNEEQDNGDEQNYNNYNNPHINIFNINIDHRKNVITENSNLFLI